MASQPLHEIRLGLIKVSIFKKRSLGRTGFSYRLERLFRDGEAWRKSGRLEAGNLLIASKALEMAYDWTQQQRNASTQQGDG